jgi:hypothetical protein
MGSAWMACRTSGLLQNAHISLQHKRSPAALVSQQHGVPFMHVRSAEQQATGNTQQLDNY